MLQAASRRQRASVAHLTLAAAFALALLLPTSCASEDHADGSSRLESMVRSSLEGLGLDPSAAEVEHEYSRCEGGTSQAEYLGFRFPQIGIDEARPLLLRLRDYWRAVAPKWAQRGFEVKDESIDAPTAPRVFLEIDGFSLAGDRTPRKEEGLEIGGSAPCVPLTE